MLQGAFKVENPNEVKVRWVGSLCYVLCDHLQVNRAVNLNVDLYFYIFTNARIMKEIGLSL